jgi:cob(I)alamin adenosyltransferase
MVKINKIYTRTGDDGTTGLIGGTRVSKCSEKVCAYGDIDELNSWVGLIRTVLDSARCAFAVNQLAIIQNVLFDLGAVLASPSDVTWPTKRTIGAADIAQIESWIDDLTSQVAELRSFVLPGGTIPNSYLHIARTVCRRAERSIIGLSAEESIPSGLLTYINRLSDYLFALARYEITSAGQPEFLWSPGTNTPVSNEPKSGE